HRDLNHLLYRLDRSDEFLRSYDDAALLYPEVGQLYLSKANVLFYAGDFENAGENFGRAAPLLPSHVTPHDGLALTFTRMGRFDEAICEHEIALKMEPDNAHAWVNYAEPLLHVVEANKTLPAA